MHKESEIRAKDISRATTIKLLTSLVWKLDRAYLFVILFSGLSQAANSVFTIFIPRILIDGYRLSWPWQKFVAVVCLLIAVKYVLAQIVAWLKRIDTVHSEIFNKKVEIHFAEKVMRMDYAKLEDAEILDLKERALFPVVSYGALRNILHDSIEFFSNIITFIAVVIILLRFSWILTLILVLMSIVGFFVMKNYMSIVREAEQEIIPYNRRYAYYTNKVLEPGLQEDFRIYDLGKPLINKINDFNLEMSRFIRRISLGEAKADSLQTITAVISRFATYSYTAMRVFTTTFGPQITIAQFSVIIGAASNFSQSLRGTLSSVLSLFNNVSHLMPFARFMLMEEKEIPSGDIKATPLESLSFEHVSFSYPNSERVVLNNLSFEIKRGERISIVGRNNAGKSTVVKLICRLFEPNSGRILWNGVDIRELDYDSYMAELSCVFQDFMIFPFTIRDNIDPQEQCSDRELWDVLAELNLSDEVKRLPSGLDTYLDKSLYKDATDLSGGQKQKIAIARAVNKEADLVILDEPTAALDPLAESEVYEHFNDLVSGRTAIFISHRMSSSLFCDKILLINNAEIVAFDSHENLMKSDNLYRELFETQAANYRN